MKYVIKRSCGHVETVHTHKNTPEHNRLSNQVCFECAVAKDLTVVASKDVRLPILTGSNEEIKQAEQIRDKLAFKLAILLEKALAHPDRRHWVVVFEMVLGKMMSVTVAEWWIEHGPILDNAYDPVQ